MTLSTNNGGTAMRFMMFIYPAVYQGEKGQRVGADFAPGAEDVEKMMKYNEELAKAGALISLDGFHPPANAAGIFFEGGRPVPMDGLAGSSKVLGGYWMIRVQSRDEAIQWASRIPAHDGDFIEIRQIFEMEDFPEDVRKAADNPTVNAAVSERKP